MKKHLVSLLLLICLVTALLPITTYALEDKESNNNFAGAQSVTLGESIEGQILLDDVDLFKFVIPDAGYVTLDVYAYLPNHTIHLYNADGEQLWYEDSLQWNSDVGFRKDNYGFHLEPATYYVKLTGYRYGDSYASEGTYKIETGFVSSNTTEKEDNNSIAKADNLGLDATVKGQISMNDRFDFFKLTLPESGRLTLDMTSYMQYYTLVLYNSDGVELWYEDSKEWNSNVGYRNDAYSLDLLPGDYYVKVTGYRYGDSYASTGTYTLKNAFVSANATETEDNNAIAQANPRELNTEVKGHIAINDRFDFYKLTLPESGRLTLDMTSYMQYYTLVLYNSDGAELWYADYKEWNSTVGYRNDVYNIDLLSGDYYVKATGYRYGDSYATTGTYTLKNAFTPANATEAEPNNSIEAATPVGITSVNHGQIAINDRNDFFRVVQKEAGVLKLDITAYTQYYSLYVYDVNGTELYNAQYNEWNSTLGYQTGEHSINLDPGDYYIKITGYRYGESYDSTGTYMLLVNHTHKWDNGVITEVPSEYSDGEKTYTCTECKATSIKVIKYLDIARIYGANRYATSFAIADALKEELGVTKFRTIIVASGTSFADALSGSYLAAQKDAPILITNGGNIKDIKAYVQNNLRYDGIVYLLGGTNAVPKSVETALSDFNVKRLGGATRYETNLLILKEAGVYGKQIIVCTGTEFADSLSASAVGQPILLVGKKLTPDQEAFLATTSGSKIIIGGTTAVNTRVEDQLEKYGAVVRIGGTTRYQTSALVADYFFENPDGIVLAYAQNFPDGLCGGPLANNMNAPLILTATGKQATAASYVKLQSVGDAYVLGGPGLISDPAVRTIFDIAANTPIPVK